MGTASRSGLIRVYIAGRAASCLGFGVWLDRRGIVWVAACRISILGPLITPSPRQGLGYNDQAMLLAAWLRREASQWTHAFLERSGMH